MLNDRSQLLFKKLMGLYLNEGKPVGSTTLAKCPEVGLSSATVRNVMSDLEKMGLIHSPHTSAGRVPTDKGYRFFVDSLLSYQPLSKQSEALIRQELSGTFSQDALMNNVSQVLSGITGMTSLVMMPNKEQGILSHIDFVSLGDSRVLVVLVFNDQDIQNRIIDLEARTTSEELIKIANFLNEFCVGQSLVNAKKMLIERMELIRNSTNEFMLSVIQATDSVLSDQIEQKVPFLVAGQSNLLNYQELAGADKLKSLFHAFEQHAEVLAVLDKSLNAQGVQVFIGNECGNDIYQDCSIVSTPYEVEGNVLGVLGVVGPSRMNYEKVVPKVDITAKILGTLLKK